MKPRTKAIEHDLCAAMEHILIHHSQTSHYCKCGYKIVFGHIESGECPECKAVEEIDQYERQKS